jgi:uncharacterized membrane protein
MAPVTDVSPAQPDPFRAPARLLTIGGAIGLLASFVLSVDKVKLLEDKIAGKSTTFSCDLSAFVSCGDVIASPQSSAFGFPNAFIGVLGFAVVLTLGVVWLGGMPVKRWIWAGLQLGSIFGIGFVTWLQFQSIYRIGYLCPYCMVVWAAMIPIFVVVTAGSLRLFAPGSAVTRFVSNWTLLIVALWYVAVAAAIWFEYGSRLWA